MSMYSEAEKIYRALGVDVDAAFRRVAEIPVSLHCWQGDDVAGFENSGSLDGGLAVTGNYPGRARTPGELRADIDKVLSLVPGTKRCYFCVAGLGAVTFGLLPFAACFVGGLDALMLGITGGIVFAAITWLFTSAADRLSTGPAAKAAPIISAFGIYLAAQALMGMF